VETGEVWRVGKVERKGIGEGRKGEDGGESEEEPQKPPEYTRVHQSTLEYTRVHQSALE
jgi:hypothetical protein